MSQSVSGGSFVPGASPGGHRVGIIMSRCHLQKNRFVVLTRRQRVLEYIRERRCAWCATFPIGKYIIMCTPIRPSPSRASAHNP